MLHREGPGRSYAALVPNVRGLRAAIDAGVGEVAVFASASERFIQGNINYSIAESIERFIPILEMAFEHGLNVRGYVSGVTDCPYEGKIAPGAVAALAEIDRVIGAVPVVVETCFQLEPKRVKMCQGPAG